MDIFLKNIRFFTQMRKSTALDFGLWPLSSCYQTLLSIHDSAPMAELSALFILWTSLCFDEFYFDYTW